MSHLRLRLAVAGVAAVASVAVGMPAAAAPPATTPSLRSVVERPRPRPELRDFRRSRRPFFHRNRFSFRRAPIVVPFFDAYEPECVPFAVGYVLCPDFYGYGGGY